MGSGRFSFLFRRSGDGPKITPFEWVAFVIGLVGLAALNAISTPDGVPVLVPSLVATAALLFMQPTLTIARTWNAIGGQTLSAAAGWICAVLILPYDEWLAIGVACGVALSVMAAARCLHPPGVATAFLMVASPAVLSWHHIFVPVALGTTLIVGWVWLVHRVERPWAQVEDLARDLTRRVVD
jgi:CBS domain-containing membrane protein